LKVLSIVFSSFPNDPRPRREAEAMVGAGHEVDMICLIREGQVPNESLYGVNVFRINIKRRRHSKTRYIWQYFSFLCISFFMAARMHFYRRYDVIHVHNMPDFLVFSALGPKIMGAKVILDLHDPMPEVYMSKYGLSNRHFVVRALILVEKISIGFSDIVITPNKSFRDLFISRGCKEDKIHIVMNSPMETIFLAENVQKEKVEIEDESFRIMFHGFITKHNGLHLALEAISIARKNIPNIRFDIFGSAENTEDLIEYAKGLQLDQIVRFHGPVSLDVIAECIANTHLGIIPNLKTPFTEINFPTRIFEYLCLKKPVIAPRTQGILDYFDRESICFFEPGNAESLAHAIIELWKDTKKREQYVSRGYPIYFNHRWELQKQRLIGLIEGAA